MRKMRLQQTANELIDSFTSGTFPEPHELTDQQIQSIASIPGVDADGTFADAPVEHSLIREYKLDVGNAENTWPAFAEVLREERKLHFSKFTDLDRKTTMDWLKNAIASCLVLGISREEIMEEVEIA